MIETKRGYVKWTDENGERHKVLESEYKALEEILEKPDTSSDESDNDTVQEPVRDGLA